MTWPILPLALRLKYGRWPSIWLPLVIFWPLVLVAFCLALPLCLVWPPVRGNAFQTLGATYSVLCALHGAEFELGCGSEAWKWSLY